MSAINWIDLARSARNAAAVCIRDARKADPQCHHTQRGVEVIAVDHLGERIGDPLEYLEVKEISGKRLAAIVNAHAPAQWDSITVQGGLDCYSSFAEAMKYPDDYEPMTDMWDVSTIPQAIATQHP